MLNLSLRLRTSFLKHKLDFANLLLQLSFLLFIRLYEGKQSSLLVSLYVSHQVLILCLQVAELVPQACDLGLHQVLPLYSTLLHNLIFSCQLIVLACAFIKLQFEFVYSGIELLELLCTQILLFILGKGSESFYFLSLNLTCIRESLIFAQQHIDLLLVLRVFVGYFGAFFLSLDQLLLYALYSLLLLGTDFFQLCLMVDIELRSNLFV